MKSRNSITIDLNTFKGKTIQEFRLEMKKTMEAIEVQFEAYHPKDPKFKISVIPFENVPIKKRHSNQVIVSINCQDN